MSKKPQYSKKLLVEGNDDVHVLLALCNCFEIEANFEILDSKGIDSLFATIPVRLKEPNFRTIGIIIDADTDIGARWKQLKKIFKEAGYTLPEDLPSEGLIAEVTEKIRICVWIMPDNNLNGMLEDFIAFLIPTDDVILPIVLEHIENLEKKGLQKFKPIHRSKAIIHAWLALQEDPGTPMGLSITKRYLTANQVTCGKFIAWLKAFSLQK
jgi:hypothetical protein